MRSIAIPTRVPGADHAPSGRSAFTLIELMIVVAIIAIIASIAIPSLLASRKSANEGRAIATLRAIATSQEMYRTRFGSFAPGYVQLEGAGYLAIAFDAYTPLTFGGSKDEWFFSIGPTELQVTGDRSFWVDQTGVIRWSSVGPALPFSPPIE